MNKEVSWACFFAVGIVCAIGLMIWHEESKPPVPPTAQELKIIEARAKWSIEFEGEFDDPRAYSGTHRIYRMKNADGTELICVTGVGLEHGSHRSGRATVEDER